MIKKIFTYILPLLGLAACSDDLEPRLPGQLDSDGTLHLSFGISPMKTVTTRAADDVSKVRMLVYSSNGTTLLQDAKIDVTGSGSSYSGRVFLNSNVLAENANPIFYFIANPHTTDIDDDAESEEGLEAAVYPAIGGANGDNLIMSSKSLSLSDVQTDVVALYHNGAKVTAHQATVSGSSYTVGSAYPFSTFVTTTESPVLAGGLSVTSGVSASKYLGSHDSSVQYSVLDTDDYAVSTAEKFVHPTDNSSSGNANKSFIIVKANYGDKDYYYRLDFQKKVEIAGTNPKEYTTAPIDIVPNHHYQFLITAISGAGFATPSEAAKNPSPMVEYQIHDHSPVIYNMISDGSRELGVARIVSNPSSTTYEATLYVKLFSSSANATNEVAEFVDLIKKDDFFRINASWLSVGSITEALTSDVITDEDGKEFNVWGDDSTNDDPNHKGTVYKVQLLFDKDTQDPGTLTTDLTVTWHGLSRDVKVEWVREFDTSKLFDPQVAFKMFNRSKDSWGKDEKDSDCEYYTADYFGKFLPKEKTPDTAESLGTTAFQNNDRARNVGLHFPMPYGETTHWTYWYKLTLNKDQLGDEFTWKVSYKNDPSSKDLNVEIINTSGDQDNRTFYIKRSADDYDYATGSLVITVTKKGASKPVTFDNVKLYHTGFFHKDNDTSASDNAYNTNTNGKYYNSNGQKYLNAQSTKQTKWLYYEVVEGGKTHWLDRNMGATSAQMYIKGASDHTQAAGYYMNAGHYWMYNDPIIYKNSVPPGYEVPSVEQWNNLKADGNFSIPLVGAYYNPMLKVGDKTVYFPKSEYYEGDNDERGEKRAGYYWTRDAGTGTEKEEIGNWLKALCFSGSSGSYINARTQGRNGETPYYMSLRAVAKSSEDVKRPEKLGFYVNGATHVFLYREDIVNGKTVRTAATSWPGKAIGNFKTAHKTFYFTYETTTSKPEDIYVIFNYVASDGKIHTYSNNEFTNDLTHTKILPENAKGWKVIDSEKTDDFKLADATNSGKCAVGISGSLRTQGTKKYSQNGTTWTIESPEEMDAFGDNKIRILWPQGDDYAYIRVTDNKGNELTTIGNSQTKSGWNHRQWDSYGYDGDWSGTDLQIPANTTNLNFEFGSSNNPSTIYVPTPEKSYTPDDVITFGNHGTNGIVIKKLKKKGDPDPTMVKYRFYWNSGYSLWERNAFKVITRPNETTFIDESEMNQDTDYPRDKTGYDNDKKSRYLDFMVPSTVSDFEIRLILHYEKDNWANESSTLIISSSKFNNETLVPGYKVFQWTVENNSDFGSKGGFLTL